MDKARGQLLHCHISDLVVARHVVFSIATRLRARRAGLQIPAREINSSLPKNIQTGSIQHFIQWIQGLELYTGWVGSK
jgi:hypothetical protein